MKSDKFKRSLNKADEAYTTYRDAFESQGAMARLTGKVYRLPNGARLKLSKEKMETLEQLQVSHTYLYTHITGGGTTALTKVFIEISARDRRAVKRAENDLYGIMGSINMGVQPLKAANKAYLLEMGPAVPAARTLTKKFLPQLLFTDENTAAFSSSSLAVLWAVERVLFYWVWTSVLGFPFQLTSSAPRLRKYSCFWAKQVAEKRTPLCN